MTANNHSERQIHSTYFIDSPSIVLDKSKQNHDRVRATSERTPSLVDGLYWEDLVGEEIDDEEPDEDLILRAKAFENMTTAQLIDAIRILQEEEDRYYNRVQVKVIRRIVPCYCDDPSRWSLNPFAASYRLSKPGEKHEEIDVASSSDEEEQDSDSTV